MNLLKHYSLLAVVFSTGFAVLVLEVVATRILTPYFGNSIYTVLSVLGVFLGALSVGYFFGGRMADRRPDARWFFSIILLSGLATLGMQYLSLTLLPAFGFKLSIIDGPLLISIALFFVPGMLLGMLSPYGIILCAQARPDLGLGRLSGQVFFVSTMGSIGGSLCAGFFLIPFLGVSNIVVYTGIALLVLGAGGLIASGGSKIAAVAAVLASLPAISHSIQEKRNEQARYLYVKDGLYEKIRVTKEKHEGKDVHYLYLDSTLSAGRYLEGKEEAVFEYMHYAELYKLLTPDMKRAAVIGGGGYIIPDYLVRSSPQVEVDAVEIEPELYPISQRYFDVEPSPRLHNYVVDGRRFLVEHKEPYDLIFLDVYLYWVPVHFTTQEFFKLLKERTKPGGVVICNVIGTLAHGKPSLFHSLLKTINSVFPNMYVFATVSNKSYDMQNFAVVLYNDEKKIDFTDPSVGSGFQSIKSIDKALVDLDRFNFDEHMVLTDDYAPTEYLTSRFFRDRISKWDPSKPKQISGRAALYNVRQERSYTRTAEKDGLKAYVRAEARTMADEFRDLQAESAVEGTDAWAPGFLARLDPHIERRLLLVAGYSHPEPRVPLPDASASAVALDIMRFYGAKETRPAGIGLDFLFLDRSSSPDADKSESSARLIERLFQGKAPLGVIVLDNLCPSELLLGPQKDALAKFPDFVGSFFERGRLVGTKYLTTDQREVAVPLETSLMAAGIPVLRLADIRANVESGCSSDALESVGNSVLSFAEKLAQG